MRLRSLEDIVACIAAYSWVLMVLLCLALSVPSIGLADQLDMSCSQNVCYLMNQNDGDLHVGTQEDRDIYFLSNTQAAAVGFYWDSSASDLLPLTDAGADLGSSSVEWKDGNFDGTVTTDALACSGDSTLGTLVVKSTGALESDATNLGLDAASGGNTACDTTCAVADGACLFGFDAGTTALVDCASALADTCICAEAVS